MKTRRWTNPKVLHKIQTQTKQRGKRKYTAQTRLKRGKIKKEIEQQRAKGKEGVLQKGERIELEEVKKMENEENE